MLRKKTLRKNKKKKNRRKNVFKWLSLKSQSIRGPNGER